jgi:hypothetical protein
MTTLPSETKPTTDDEGYPAPYSTYSRADAIAMNIAFARTMLWARRRGFENFTIGARTDDTPFVPKVYSRAIVTSGIGSSASLCAESGDAGHIVGPRMGRS